MKIKLFRSEIPLLSLLALLLLTSVEAGELIVASIVKYQISEPNVEPYISRMVVTPTQIRMDDNESSGNFLIFSRDKSLIESVNHEEQSVLVIRAKSVEIEQPMPLEQATELVPLNEAPVVAGTAPRQYKLSVNGEQCQSVVSVDGLLADVVVAWRQFRQVLAGEHAATLPYVPADQQLGCDLALHIYFPGWFLDFGLPIQSFEVGGKGMVLIDYLPEQQVDSALFDLPEGYHRYSKSR